MISTKRVAATEEGLAYGNVQYLYLYRRREIVPLLLIEEEYVFFPFPYLRLNSIRGTATKNYLVYVVYAVVLNVRHRLIGGKLHPS